MTQIYIGIDPSMNSTGVVLQLYDDNNLIQENIFIVKPNKLTGKEQIAQDSGYIKYVLYSKEDVDKNAETQIKELAKTHTLMNIVDAIKYCLFEFINNADDITVTMEGLSYGSTQRTSAIMELAGLNFMIRNMLLTSNKNIKLNIMPPTVIKKWVTGYGTASKDAMISAFQSLRPNVKVPKVDDIADAWWMCSYGKEKAES